MKKRIFCLLLALLMAFQMALMVSASNGGKVADESREGVVFVLTVDVYGQPLSRGTAFGVGEAGEETEFFVTNMHVIWDDYMGNVAAQVYILKNSNAWIPNTFTLDTAQCIPCDVLEYDAEHDLAILEASEPVPGRVALPLLSKEEDSEIAGGENVYAIGYPASSDILTQDDFGTKFMAGVDDSTITSGVVSRIATSNLIGDGSGSTKVIQHDAQVNHGNSGGPLLDDRGAVIGVNTILFGQDTSSGDGNSYASVRISYAREMLEDLDIEYDVYANDSWILPAIIGAIVVLIILIVVIIVVLVKKNNKPEPAPAPVPVPVPQPPISQHPHPVTQNAPDYRPRLQGLNGAFAGKRFSLDNSVRIGRDPNKNDLVFPQNTQGVSGIHCVLMVEGSTVWLKDLGSTYGTYIAGGRRLAANEAVQLRIGDKFWLGSEKEVFVIAPKGGI